MQLALKNKFWKYFTVLEINRRNRTNNLVVLTVRGLSVMLRVWILTQLYLVGYRSIGSKSVGGFTLAMSIWSLAIAFSLQYAARPRVCALIEKEVQDGSFAYSINKPYSYALFHLAGYFGRCAPALVTNFILSGIAALLLVGKIPTSPTGLLTGALFMVIGLTLDFLFAFAIGLTAFWFESAEPFWWVYHKLQVVFAGVVIPIALFPDALRRVIEVLPFSQLFYSSARMVVGYDSHLFFKYLIVQVSWFIIMVIAVLFLFKRGIKHVTANGG